MTIRSRTDDLQILISVVDSGSLSAAARSLDLQVARVSRALARLEQSLGCTLLYRTTRRIELTEEGRRFLQLARQGLDRLGEAEQTLRESASQPAGRLRVDAVTPFMIHQILPLVPGFRERHPLIELELVTNENIIDLIERRTDVAIRIGELEDSSLHARTLGRSPLHIVASPGYLQSRGTPQEAAELADHDLIGFTDAPHLNRWPLDPPLSIRPTLASSSGESIRQLCLAGQGLALLSEFMIHRDIEHGRLVSVLGDALITPNRREPVNAVFYRNTLLSSRIKAFLDHISPQLQLRVDG